MISGEENCHANCPNRSIYRFCRVMIDVLDEFWDKQADPGERDAVAKLLCEKIDSNPKMKDKIFDMYSRTTVQKMKTCMN